MEHEAEAGRTEAEPGSSNAELGPTEAEPGSSNTELGATDAEPVPTDPEPGPTGATGGEAAETPAEPTTGEPRVDAALRLLERLPGLPVSDHPELFEQVHARLSEVLDELESGSGAAGPAGG